MSASSFSAINPMQSSTSPMRTTPWLESIIDKKVNKVALNCFEGFVHWFLTTFSCFYPSYKSFYDHSECINQLAAQKAHSPIRHQLDSGITVLDKTINSNVSVNMNAICLKGREIIFGPHGGNSFTEYYPPLVTNVTVSNVRDQSGVFKIDLTLDKSAYNPSDHRDRFGIPIPYDYPENEWLVDTNKEFLFLEQHYPFQPSKRVFVVESRIARGFDPEYLQAVPNQDEA